MDQSTTKTAILHTGAGFHRPIEMMNDVVNGSALHNTQNSNQGGYESIARQDVDGNFTMTLLVQGVHCAGCIQKIESALHRFNAVKKARLNFSTGGLHLIWQGAAADSNTFVHAIESLGYRVQPYSPSLEKSTAEAEDRFLLLCLGVAGFAMGNIMLLSVGLWTTTTETMGMATRDFFHMISGLIAVPTVLFSGRPFFRSAFKALSNGHTNMDVPISVGLSLATGISLYETFTHGEHAYFDSAVMLIFFLLIGRYLDFRARRLATSAAHDLMQTFVGFATVIEDNQTRKIPIRDLREGMIASVAAGEKFPADSCIVTGESTVDTSLVTGETLPRAIQPESEVYAGTLNISAPVTIRILKAAENSLLADIVRLMEKAQQAQAQYVRLADKAAKLYTPVVHTLAAASFLFWFFIMGAGWHQALMIAVAVLIITCPCALGLAVPVVQVLAVSRLMKIGVLVKSGDALERLARIDTIIFDKTGTLTIGKPVLSGAYDPPFLQMAASLAHHSKHVLAQALSSEYTGKLLPLETIQEFAGKGLEATYQGRIIRLGARSWCGNPAAPKTDQGSEIWLQGFSANPIVFTFSDALRADAQETLTVLKSRGLRTVLLSGDIQSEASRIAHTLGITEFYGEKTPPEKYDMLLGYKQKGACVLMVGDGLNDAPVLMGADVSMAPGSAIDMAQSAADIVFMGGKLMPVATAQGVALQTQKLVKQNFFLAIVYNAVAIPLAFFGFVTPFIAAIAMSGSSLLVVANAFRLRLHT